MILPGAEPEVGLDRPLDLLAACHGRIRRFCALLRRLAEPDTPFDPEAAARVHRYFETAGRDHHADEEVDLFPRLRRLRPDLAPLLERLVREHRELERLWAVVAPGLAAPEAGRDAAWREAAARFCALSLDHAALEDAELLPAARETLDAAALGPLGRAMAARRGVPYPGAG